MSNQVGVFLCDCAASIRNVDFARAKQTVATFPGVAHVSLSSSLCKENGLQDVAGSIAREKIDRVVIAACSPLFKENIRRQGLEKIGLNPGLVSFANIREQCAWTNDSDMTEKATDLIRMSVNQSRWLAPLKTRQVKVNQNVLIIGSGFSAQSAGFELLRLGYPLIMVDQASSLSKPSDFFEKLLQYDPNASGLFHSINIALKSDENVRFFNSSEVVTVLGEVGNFQVEIKTADKKNRVDCGAIVVATGVRKEALSEQNTENVIVSLPISVESLHQRKNTPHTIVFIIDLFEMNYRISSLLAISNALAIKSSLRSEVYVLARDLKVDSEGAERTYRLARDKGVIFIKYLEKPGWFEGENGIVVRVKDLLLGQEEQINCDLLVLDREYVAASELEKSLKMGRDSRGFYQEINPYLWPVLSRRKGIYAVGSCREDADLTRAYLDAASVAAQINELLLHPGIEIIEGKVRVDSDKCRICLTCFRACPRSAISFQDVDPESSKEFPKKIALISDLACSGCGLCVAVCPAKAIHYEGYSDAQILAEIEGALVNG